MVVGDVEREEDPQPWLERYPDPSLATPDSYHRLLHEDRADEPPVNIEPLPERGKALEMIQSGNLWH